MACQGCERLKFTVKLFALLTFDGKHELDTDPLRLINFLVTSGSDDSDFFNDSSRLARSANSLYFLALALFISLTKSSSIQSGKVTFSNCSFVKRLDFLPNKASCNGIYNSSSFYLNLGLAHQAKHDLGQSAIIRPNIDSYLAILNSRLKFDSFNNPILKFNFNSLTVNISKSLQEN
ncbi:hypothetical protein BpHYR1_047488 [Brachionus plicatilis]|uniref:Uncharacterized protein n=1 Tax=Brachionus plicatilis TaxID=10195 RepID=A0A3M7QEL6_BRAPC|nr:hypothetical protein BpHYR1_047488 [Brachionus plicatilis]